MPYLGTESRLDKGVVMETACLLEMRAAVHFEFDGYDFLTKYIPMIYIQNKYLLMMYPRFLRELFACDHTQKLQYN